MPPILQTQNQDPWGHQRFFCNVWLKPMTRWMNRCMEWGNALKHLGLPWGGAGLTTQAPESWESGVTGEGVGLVASCAKNTLFLLFLGTSSSLCASTSACMLLGSNFTTTLQRQHINFPPNLPFENMTQTCPQETNALSFNIDAVIYLHHQTQQG